MIGCDLARAALATAVVFVQDPRWLPALLALAVAQAAASVFFEPARAAFVPVIVERGALLAANSFSQTTRIVSMSAGAALAGLLLALPHGMKLVFALDALTFVVSALALGSIRVSARAAPPAVSESAPRPAITAELIEGLRALFRNPTLVALLATFTITLLGLSAVTVLFVPFMLRDLRASTLAIGLVRGAQTLGIVAGGGLMVGPLARWTPGRVLTLGIAGLGPCLALMGLVPHWVALLPLLALAGVCSSAIQTGSATLLQHAIPDQGRGRAESAFDTLLTAVMLVAMAGAGVLGDRFGARVVFVVAGVLTITAGFAGRVWLARAPRVEERTFVAER
jgi:MFS family permease